jgi:hypothetical protein
VDVLNLESDRRKTWTVVAIAAVAFPLFVVGFFNPRLPVVGALQGGSAVVLRLIMVIGMIGSVTLAVNELLFMRSGRPLVIITSVGFSLDRGLFSPRHLTWEETASIGPIVQAAPPFPLLGLTGRGLVVTAVSGSRIHIPDACRDRSIAEVRDLMLAALRAQRAGDLPAV